MQFHLEDEAERRDVRTKKSLQKHQKSVKVSVGVEKTCRRLLKDRLEVAN